MSSTEEIINDEISEAKKLYPVINVMSQTPSSICVNYKRGYNCVAITLAIPNGYPTNPLAVSIDKDAIIPSGLKKRLEKELNEVANEKTNQNNNSAHQQVAAVWGRLVSFLDTNLAIPTDFPCGSNSAKVQNHIRKAFGKDARASIQSFQQTNSLHSYFAKAFGTVPVYEASQQKENQQQDSSTNTNNIEALDPSPALQFLSHLGVSRHEVHSRVATALRTAIEDEIQRMPLPSTNSSNNRTHHRGSADEDRGHQSLLRLLQSAWLFRDVPELRPVLICLLKRLGENTPVIMLRTLGAKKGDGSNELKHADLISQLGPHMQRLIWEADWDAKVKAANSNTDGNNKSEEEITLRGSTILADFIQPAVDQYVNDGVLVQAAELAFVGGISERRHATKSRRMEAKDSDVKGDANEASSGTLASIAVGGKTFSKAGKDEKVTTPSSAHAITSIKETLGRRPKLLGAVLDMLISEYAISGGGFGNFHSMTAEEKRKKLLRDGGFILGGATNLTCTLVSDLLLSFGQLPRSYEALGILARLLDAAVQVGAISDNTLAQIQGCLRTLFRPTESDSSQKPPVTPTKTSATDNSQPVGGSGKKIKLSLKNIPTKMFPDHPIDDSEFERKLLQKVLKKAIAQMKENDPQGLFLNPVTDAIAPGYSSIIKRPMCIRTIEEQMMQSSYDSIEDFRDDVSILGYFFCVCVFLLSR